MSEHKSTSSKIFGLIASVIFWALFGACFWGFVYLFQLDSPIDLSSWDFEALPQEVKDTLFARAQFGALAGGIIGGAVQLLVGLFNKDS